MEGLIPFVLHVLKRNASHSKYRCLSEGSARSNHRVLLTENVGIDSFEGSSHRRTNSEFQPPPVSEFQDWRSSEFRERRSGSSFIASRSFEQDLIVRSSASKMTKDLQQKNDNRRK
ncbi:beta-1,4-xylosidase [Tasmannia lanceolata]|uniref:beta-1,4-xylosidase n=1 Tax=Tasmannia lanceolata TaxID=3420 RepID=UPI004063A9C8